MFLVFRRNGCLPRARPPLSYITGGILVLGDVRPARLKEAKRQIDSRQLDPAREHGLLYSGEMSVLAQAPPKHCWLTRTLSTIARCLDVWPVS